MCDRMVIYRFIRDADGLPTIVRIVHQKRLGAGAPSLSLTSAPGATPEEDNLSPQIIAYPVNRVHVQKSKLVDLGMSIPRPRRPPGRASHHPLDPAEGVVACLTPPALSSTLRSISSPTRISLSLSTSCTLGQALDAIRTGVYAEKIRYVRRMLARGEHSYERKEQAAGLHLRRHICPLTIDSQSPAAYWHRPCGP